MKQIIPVLLLLAFAVPGHAQEEKKKSPIESVTKILIIEPGISHEISRGRLHSLLMQGGLTISIYGNEFRRLQSRFFGELSLRNYYNHNNRKKYGMLTDHNSGNYFGLNARVLSAPLSKTVYNDYYHKAITISGLVWGLQCNYPSGFSLDFNLGPGVILVNRQADFAIMGKLNFGFWLKKKKKE